MPSSSDLSESVTRPPPPVPAPSSTSIKDKPSDLGIKPITNNESWIDAKKIIDAQLRRAPYWPGDSKELVTTDANAAASVCWEEVIAFYCKPPVSDLFVEEHRFDGKGFEMIAHIDNHFNPSRAVDSLGYIFDLIDIKQLDQESVVTWKARFSHLFSALKMGGTGIDSALQVGFMLRALLSRYQAVVQEFCLGPHSLTEASLQTVVEQCTNYNKDPWKGPVGRDGKVTPCGTPSANAVGSDLENAYEVLAPAILITTCVIVRFSRTLASGSRNVPRRTIRIVRRPRVRPRLQALRQGPPRPQPIILCLTAGWRGISSRCLQCFNQADEFDYKGKPMGPCMVVGVNLTPVLCTCPHLAMLLP